MQRTLPVTLGLLILAPITTSTAPAVGASFTLGQGLDPLGLAG